MFNMSSQKANEVSNMQFTKTEKTDKMEVKNTKEVYILSADSSITNIQTNLCINKNTGDITELCEGIKQSSNTEYYSGFLGIINVMGVNFLMFAKEVHILFALDGKDKIFEIVSLEFKEITSQYINKQTKEIEQFLQNIQKYLCKKGGYYYSYTYPLTLSQQKLNDLRKLDQNTQKPVYHLADNDFLWNHHLLKPLVDHKVSKDWQPQLIQGHIQNLIIGNESKTKMMFYTIISRRQCKRGGTRYSHRGVDSDGYVANFVESEQILVVPSMNRIVSYVQIRGSIPSYWSQRGLSAKLVLESSQQLSDLASSLHFDYIKTNYYNVINVNLVSDHKSDEVKLKNEYKRLIYETSTANIQTTQFKKSVSTYLNYFEFDFHQEVKGDKFENIDNFIIKSFLADVKNHGFFVKKYNIDETPSQLMSLNDQEGQIQWQQKCVVRTNCVDCLDRTNFFQLRLAFIVLKQIIFPYLGVDLKNQKDQENLLKDFQYSWGVNGDRISRHYAGTKATTSVQARKGKSGVFGFIKGKLTSGQRFFKGTFSDSFKQLCYNVILGEHYESQQNLQYQEKLLKELKIAENKFTKYNFISIFAASWSVNSFTPTQKPNLGAIFKNNQIPSSLNLELSKSQSSMSNQNGQLCKDEAMGSMCESLPTPMSSFIKCDIVIVSLQEIAELSAKNFLQRSESKYSELQKQWKDLIHEQIGGEQDYFLLGSHNMAGVTTYIFAKKWLKERISDIEFDDVPNSFGGKLLNKGGVGMRFFVDDTSIAVLNCHLPAGQSNIDKRVSSLNQIHEKLFQKEGMANFKRDPIWKSDKVILMGNLNFRVDKKVSDCQQDIQQIITLGKELQMDKYKKEIDTRLFAFDQLRCLQSLISQSQLSIHESDELGIIQEECFFKELKNFVPQSTETKKYYQQHQSESEMFLKHYYEKIINFLPTYKFNVGTNNYDNSWKPRVPSFSDRILIWDIEKQNQNIEDSFIQYDHVPGLNDSDHKPVYAILRFEVKEIDCNLRNQFADEILFKQSFRNQNEKLSQDEKEIKEFQQQIVENILTDNTVI